MCPGPGWSVELSIPIHRSLARVILFGTSQEVLLNLINYSIHSVDFNRGELCLDVTTSYLSYPLLNSSEQK